MNESSLAQTIDKLAQKKAEDLLTNMRSAINSALNQYWRSKDAGQEFHPMDIKNVLMEYAESIGPSGTSNTRRTVKPTAELVNSCRAHVLNTLLAGLPKIAELAAMAAENDIDPQG